MNRKVTFYVVFVSLAALLSGAALYLAAPSVSSDSAKALLLLSFLAVVAETLALVLPNSARGSLAFIPYLASAVISPNWASLAALAAVKGSVEGVRRTDPRVAMFNVAQHVLTLSSAIWAFRWLGGQSLLTLSGDSFLSVSVRDGMAALLAFG